MSNFDPAFSGYCSCGNPSYRQSVCDDCDNAVEIESREEEEKILCCVCEDQDVLKEGDMCPVCKEESEEAQADMYIKEDTWPS